jgi:hypothetical protein
MHSVNAGLAKQVHARIMIQGRIDTINPDSIDAQLFEEGKVAGASGAICQRVNESGRFKERVARRRDHSPLRSGLR